LNDSILCLDAGLQNPWDKMLIHVFFKPIWMRLRRAKDWLGSVHFLVSYSNMLGQTCCAKYIAVRRSEKCALWTMFSL